MVSVSDTISVGQNTFNIFCSNQISTLRIVKNNSQHMKHFKGQKCHVPIFWIIYFFSFIFLARNYWMVFLVFRKSLREKRKVASSLRGFLKEKPKFSFGMKKILQQLSSKILWRWIGLFLLPRDICLSFFEGNFNHRMNYCTGIRFLPIILIIPTCYLKHCSCPTS